MDFLLDLPKESPYTCVVIAFVIGALVAPLLNRCIARLPLQKSIFWPGSRCDHCAQPIRFLDRIPLISYVLLRGKCRHCKQPFSSRYFWIEFLTGFCFAGLYWLEVVVNVRNVGMLGGMGVDQELKLAAIWAYHAVFLSFLIVATFTDIDHQEIPLAITVTGTIAGIIGGVLAPWPWPLDFGSLNWSVLTYGGLTVSSDEFFVIPAGLQRMPFWMPPPEWMAPGTWPMGLATAAGGAVIGTLGIRLLRWLFTWGLRKEAMGLGDADLMMLIGAFLGWQALPLVMIAAVFLGLVYSIYLIIAKKGHELPFGPYLAGGAILTLTNGFGYLGDVGVISQHYLFDWPLLFGFSIVAIFLMTFVAVALRMLWILTRTA